MTSMINRIRNGKSKIKKHFWFQTWHAKRSSGIHIYLLLNVGSSIGLVFESKSSNNHYLYEKIWEGMVKSMIKKYFKFQTWHAMWSSGLHIYLLLTSGSSRWLVFERIFSNNHEIHDRYEKKWKNERSKGIFNFKRDMLCEVQGSISSFFWL